jgi:tetratricopeptide (TPR) repeat protein
MARAYRLYDEGINARMRGDYSSAVVKLTESWKLFNEARGYQRTGEPSINEALVHYELGQAAEGAGDILTARDSYMRCLNIRPTFVQASVSLVNMLAASGQWQLALAKAQDAVRTNPNDPRAHKLWSLTLSKTGHSEEARHEANKAQECLKYVPSYKPMGIDAVWRRTHHEDGSVKSGTGSDAVDTPSSQDSSGASDVDNPEDVMGVEEEPEEED